jgi:hypothetical protein
MSKLERLDIKVSKATPGYKLIEMLVAKTQQLASAHKIDSLKDACTLMNITPSHFTLLRNGGADITKIGKDKVDSFALFLGWPSMSIRFLAGQITIQDLYTNGGTEAFQFEVFNALDVIKNDIIWGTQLPDNFHSLDINMQLYLIRLYEEAADVKLLEVGFNPDAHIREKQIKKEPA